MISYILYFVGAIELTELNAKLEKGQLIKEYSDLENEAFYKEELIKLKELLEFKKNNIFMNLHQCQKKLLQNNEFK